MNAGAYGQELSQFAVSARALNSRGEVYELVGEGLRFGYRKSAFTDTRDVILSCTFLLQTGDVDVARRYLKELNAKRKFNQPLEYPSAGSTFKRPPGNYAGALIENSGLKGYAIGGAEVSKKHAGFSDQQGRRFLGGYFKPDPPRAECRFAKIRRMVRARDLHYRPGRPGVQAS